MNIQELQKKYSLSKDDFWELKRGYSSVWIITHDACEKIASIEKINLENIEVLNSEWDFCRLLVTMKKEDKKETSVGEALLNDGSILKTTKKKGRDGKEYDNHTYKGNCESQYVGAMAEKRGKDRCILKLINAYEYGIYSDSESDEFKKNETNERIAKELDSGLSEEKKKELAERGELKCLDCGSNIILSKNDNLYCPKAFDETDERRHDTYIANEEQEEKLPQA